MKHLTDFFLTPMGIGNVGWDAGLTWDRRHWNGKNFGKSFVIAWQN